MRKLLTSTAILALSIGAASATETLPNGYVAPCTDVVGWNSNGDSNDYVCQGGINITGTANPGGSMLATHIFIFTGSNPWRWGTFTIDISALTHMHGKCIAQTYPTPEEYAFDYTIGSWGALTQVYESTDSDPTTGVHTATFQWQNIDYSDSGVGTTGTVTSPKLAENSNYSVFIICGGPTP